MILSTIIATFLYILVDICYVILSKQYYTQKIINIQGKPFVDKPGLYISTVLSYIILAIVWYNFIGLHVAKQPTYKDAIYRGLLLGLAIYGVFNTTLYVMFEKWDIFVSIRDTIWGTSWITISGILYLTFLKNYKK